MYLSKSTEDLDLWNLQRSVSFFLIIDKISPVTHGGLHLPLIVLRGIHLLLQSWNTFATPIAITIVSYCYRITHVISIMSASQLHFLANKNAELAGCSQ